MNQYIPYVSELFIAATGAQYLPSIIAEAKKHEKEFLTFGDSVYDTSGLKICNLYELRIELDVPFSEKEDAKSIGAKWDGDKRVWYAVPKKCEELNKLFKFSRKNDRSYLTCTSIANQVAVVRGAVADSNNRLFVPNWYWVSYGTTQLICRLCYWLPKEHVEFKSFNSIAESANWLMINTGMPVDQYLVEEREYLLGQVKKKSGIYLNGNYFRYRIWDTW